MRRCVKMFLIALMIPLMSIAQGQIQFKGKVVDEKGTPILGASVTEKKKPSNGVATDFEGNFSISLPLGASVKISYIGYLTQEVKASASFVKVTLKEDLQNLDEVVLIGYQTVRKADLTGAVSVFKPELMKNTVITGTVGDALSTVPGLFVRSSGNPGAEGVVQIRGTATFGNSTPLYVIDGIAVGTANRDFNYNDIESIQVLKDASAAAIYGSRAANGVIIITTKKGKEGKMKIDISSKTTCQWLPRYNLMNREEWIAMNDLAFKNAGQKPAQHAEGNTNWQREVFRLGLLQDHDVSFSGGGKQSQYFTSLNYQSNSGTTYGSSSRRVTGRVNTSSSVDWSDSVKFSIGENLIISNYYIDELTTNPIIDVYRMLPTIPIYDKHNVGGYGYGDGKKDVTFGTNPIAREDLEDVTNENLRLRGNAFAELELFKMLKYRFNFGLVTSSDSHSNLRKEGNWSYNKPVDPTSLNRNRAFYKSMTFDNTLELNKKLGMHDIAAIVGTSYMSDDYSQIWGTKNNVLMTGNTYFKQLDGALSDPKTGSYQNLSKLFSVFGRLNYTLNGKYMLSATVRRDSSSKFGPKYRNGVFPSIAGAWRIGEEGFFKNRVVNDLKLRANYGILGSSNIGEWDWTPYINVFPQAIFGTDQSVHTGMTQVKLVNSNLKWEELEQLNAGFDLVMFDHRLEVNADYFLKTTRDVLTQMQILMSTGNNGGNPMVNAASLENKGFELSVNWKDQIGDFRYSVGLNTSYVKNKILELGYGREFFTQWDTKSYVGSPIGDWYLIKTDGIFRSQQEVLDHVNSKGKLIQPNAQPGDVRYVDYNDDGNITDADRQYAGHSLPTWSAGTNLSFEYKGFDLFLQFTGAFGHKIFNGPRSAFDRFDDNSNYRKDYDAFDLVNNPNGKDPRPLYGDARNVRRDQDRWLEDGDYLRLKQVALGYNLPKDIFGNGVENVRVFVNAQNVFTLTKYTGLDPEFLNSSIWDRSYDGGAYPNPYGFTLGVQLKF